jgi:acetyl-CoA carboxylase biotin carboxyl carrier protein
MLKFDDICELIRLVGSSEVTSVEIEHGGSRVRIEGQPRVATTPAVTVAPAAQLELVDSAPLKAVAAAAGEEATPAEDEDLHVVTSPIVGTFYRAPNPDADPYVKAGDFVEKGQVLCIVEAMKLMNEIECDASGTVVRVFQENEQPVEYGQPLFALRSA